MPIPTSAQLPKLSVHEDLKIQVTSRTPVMLSESPSGVIANIADNGTKIEFRDARGRLTRSVAKAGAGEGFRKVSELYWLADTLVARDSLHFTLLSVSGNLIRSITLPAEYSSADQSLAVPRQFLWGPQFETLTATGGVLFRAMIPAAIEAPSPFHGPAGYRYVAASIQGTITAQVLAGSDVKCMLDLGPTVSVGIPFCSRDIDRPAPDGSRIFVATVGNGPDSGFIVVRSIRSDGELDYLHRVPFSPLPVTPAILDSVLKLMPSGRDSAENQRRRDAARKEARAFQAPLLGMLPGSDGTVWLKIRTPGSPGVSWAGLGKTGQPLGMVQLPDGAQPFSATATAIWYVEKGSGTGLLTLHRLRIQSPT